MKKALSVFFLALILFSVSTAQATEVSYSTNTKEAVKNGNSGVYAYVDGGYSYDIYYIIDFDEGYVYYFTEGNGEEGCVRQVR